MAKRNYYTVKTGDSWFRIAGRLYKDFFGGDEVAAQRMAFELAQANEGIDRLRPGMRIRVPRVPRGTRGNEPYIPAGFGGTQATRQPATTQPEARLPQGVAFPGTSAAAQFSGTIPFQDVTPGLPVSTAPFPGSDRRGYIPEDVELPPPPPSTPAPIPFPEPEPGSPSTPAPPPGQQPPPRGRGRGRRDRGAGAPPTQQRRYEEIAGAGVPVQLSRPVRLPQSLRDLFEPRRPGDTEYRFNLGLLGDYTINIPNEPILRGRTPSGLPAYSRFPTYQTGSEQAYAQARAPSAVPENLRGAFASLSQPGAPTSTVGGAPIDDLSQIQYEMRGQKDVIKTRRLIQSGIAPLVISPFTASVLSMDEQALIAAGYTQDRWGNWIKPAYAKPPETANYGGYSGYGNRGYYGGGYRGGGGGGGAARGRLVGGAPGTGLPDRMLGSFGLVTWKGFG